MQLKSRFIAILSIWGVVLLLQMLGLLRPLDDALLDLRFSANSRPTSGSIIFVDIDSRSLAEVGVWPWPRHIYADLLDRLTAAGAAETAFDIDFSSSSSEAEDARFEQALEQAGGYAMLAAFQQVSGATGDLMFTLPLARFAAHAAPVLVNVSSVTGAMVRTFTGAVTNEGAVYPSMAAALSFASVPPDVLLNINFAIDAATVRRISFVDVLEGRFDAESFRDKQVVVGASAVELRDIFTVPRFGDLPGSVVQILAAETLMQDLVPRELGHWPGFTLVLILGCIFIIAPARSLAGFVATLAAMGLSAEISALVAQGTAVVLAETVPLHAGLLGLAAACVVRELALKRAQHMEAARQRDLTKTMLDRVVADNFDGVLVLDENTTIVAASSLAEMMLGDGASILGKKAEAILPADMAALACAVLKGRAGPVPGRPREVALHLAEGNRVLEYVVKLSIVRLTSGEGKPEVERRIACLTFRDITERRRNEDRLSYLASHDPLTGAFSRSHLVEQIEKSISDVEGHASGATVILIDLGRLRAINDTLGHSFGDEVLKQAAQRLKAKGAAVARVGGSSFAIWIDRELGTDEIAEACKDSIDSIVAPYQLGEYRGLLAAHAGVSTTRLSGLDAERLLSHADMALSLAKQTRGNGFRTFAPAMEQAVVQNQQLEAELRQAIEEGQFVLFYQPQIDLQSGTYLGAEALVRWNHPRRGRVPPEQFIALAEETGAIVDLGRWILLQACMDAVSWPLDTKVAVNVSPIQFELGDVLADIRSALAASGLAPERLDIEITEGVFVSGGGSTSSELEQIRRMGIGIAIDDFGTGYSSLSYVGRLPVDKIKIDQSFVRNLPQDEGAMAIVQTVISLARSLRKTVVAEGVETASQQAILAGLGCHIGQGYMISKPIPNDELLKLYSAASAPKREIA